MVELNSVLYFSDIFVYFEMSSQLKQLKPKKIVDYYSPHSLALTPKTVTNSHLLIDLANAVKEVTEITWSYYLNI